MNTTEATTRHPATLRPAPPPLFCQAPPGRARHDFLVLNMRPELTPEFCPPPVRGQANELVRVR